MAELHSFSNGGHELVTDIRVWQKSTKASGENGLATDKQLILKLSINNNNVIIIIMC